ncbi:MAG: SusD/RagB family nutrient-binding outer membrane lipoprotein [Bacteroidales bacterium]|jgi:hypothetical protein|nr:SusD/RagB family nutrient-binding outer membrane lipoprotein [Bacteroidales bacterium]
MKKIYCVVSIILAIGTFASCDDKLDELWKDPTSNFPAPSVDNGKITGSLTALQNTSFWQKGYGDWWYHFVTSGMPTLIQVSTRPVRLRKGTVIDKVGTIDVNDWNDAFPDQLCHFALNNYGDPLRAIGAGNGEDRARFSSFYTSMAPYMEIRDGVAKASGEDLDNYLIYERLATVLKDVVALQTVDLFNKIPYSQALKGTDNLHAPYDDDPQAIYHAVIEEYADIAKNLPAIYDKMSEKAKKTFKTADAFFQGDAAKWVQYINGQILRSCVRISGVDEAYIKPFLAEAIKNLPQEDFTMPAKETNQCRWGVWGNGGIYTRALYEAYGGNGSGNIMIPDVMMLRMNRGDVKYEVGTDDPRLPVIGLGFTPTEDANDLEFYGISGNNVRNYKVMYGNPGGPSALEGEKVRKNIYPQDGRPDAAGKAARYFHGLDVNGVGNPDEFVKGCPWTMYNPVTYILGELPMNIETRAEMDLFLAEVALKGLATTGQSAGDHIKDAVLHSVDYWYKINASGPETYITEKVPYSDLAKKILQPAKNTAAATQYTGIIQQEFNAAGGEDGKMEILMQQKYIHLNLHGLYELFAELRRTRHPKLEPITSYSSDAVGLTMQPALKNVTMPFERYRYPESEQTVNKEQYDKVAADDNWTTPVFWANKSSESYFLPKALKD